jgi:hypothetical protein
MFSGKLSLPFSCALMAFAVSALAEPAPAQAPVTLEDMEDLSDLTWWNRGEIHGTRETWGTIDITPTQDCREGKSALLFNTRLGKGVTIEKDLSALRLNLDDYDYLKFDCKLEGGRVYLVIGLEHAPYAKGRFVDWYPADSATEPFDWRTVCLDLRWPEEVRDVAPPETRKLYIQVSPYETARTDEAPWRKITFDNFRLVKKVIDVDWDQRKAPHETTAEGDLLFTYDLRVANTDDKPHTVVGRLETKELVHAKAAMEKEQFRLDPGEVIMFKVRVWFPAASLRTLKPLYCEPVYAWFRAEGVADSETTILRSSDAIPLTVTVPLPGDAQPPFVPDHMLRTYDERFVKPKAERALDGRVALELKNRALHYAHESWTHDGYTAQHLGRLYRDTGDRKYAEAARRIILTYAEGHARAAGAFRDRGNTGVQTIHATRFNTTTLGAGWFMRPLLNGYDAIHDSGVLSEADKRCILDDFFLPMAIIMRNHLIGLGNQQCEVNYVINYVGLLAKNWPLVSFAYSSHEGLLSQIRYNFSEDGFASEGHYHYAVLIPLVNQAEIMTQAGVNVYGEEIKRLFTSYCAKYPLAHTHRIDGLLKIAADRLKEPSFLPFSEGKVPQDVQAGHLPFYGYTCLRQTWNGDLRAAAVNWGHQEYRNTPDRMAVEFYGFGQVLVGGRDYSHSSLDQSTLMVDMQDQDPQRGVVDYLDAEGDVQVVSASTRDDAPLYPGVTLTRTLALIRGCLLSVDRAVSDTQHTYDEVQYVGTAASPSLEFQELREPWGKEHGYEKINEARDADAAKPWTVEWALDPRGERVVRITHVPVGPMRALLGSKAPRGKKILLLRTRGKTADWITFTEVFEKKGGPRLSAIERAPVRIDRRDTDQAVGLKLVLDGTEHTAVINYSSKEATCGGVTAAERWGMK